MHRSRIGVFLIDHPTESYDAAAAFWAGARGTHRDPTGTLKDSTNDSPSHSPNDSSDDGADDDPYESLDGLPGGLKLELQRVGTGTAARIHLDIETDDVPAEVSRVVALGATVVERREGYAILADPGGVLFCVVPIQTGADFETHATTW